MIPELSNLEATTGKIMQNLYQGLGTQETLQNNPSDLAAQFYRSLSQNEIFSSSSQIMKTVGIVATLVLGFLFVFIVWRIEKYHRGKHLKLESLLSPPSPGTGAYDARWQEVRRHIESFKDAEWRMAVIEADKIVEEILSKGGFPGETLGEKLTLINQNQLQSIDELWIAHKLRNRIAHDTKYQAHHTEARQAIEYYEKVLHELGALS